MKQSDPVWWDCLDTPCGPFFAALTPRGLVRAALGGTAAAFLALPGLGGAGRDPERLAPALALVAAYFTRRFQPPDLALDLTPRTPFQQEVLRAVMAIPAGQMRTYGDLARQLGRPRAARAVGAVNAANPLPLIIPCHRLVGRDGSLRGYGSGEGIATKRWLLAFEREA